MDIDEAFRTVGEYGCLQRKVFWSMALPQMFLAWQHMQNVFTAKAPQFFCFREIIESKSDMETVAFLNFTSDSRMDKGCSLDPVNDPCKWYEFSDIEFTSIASEWNLVCDSAYKVDVVQSIIMAGLLVGNLIGGYFADHIGRKPVAYVNMLGIFFFSILALMSNSYGPYVILRFLAGVCCGAYGLISFTLPAELVGPSQRGYINVVTSVTFALGISSLSLMAYFIRDWRLLSFITSLPGLLGIYYYLKVPESPRWLLIHGLIKEAEDELDYIWKTNQPHLFQNKLSSKLVTSCTFLDREYLKSKIDFKEINSLQENLQMNIKKDLFETKGNISKSASFSSINATNSNSYNVEHFIKESYNDKDVNKKPNIQNVDELSVLGSYSNTTMTTDSNSLDYLTIMDFPIPIQSESFLIQIKMHISKLFLFIYQYDPFNMTDYNIHDSSIIKSFKDHSIDTINKENELDPSSSAFTDPWKNNNSAIIWNDPSEYIYFEKKPHIVLKNPRLETNRFGQNPVNIGIRSLLQNSRILSITLNNLLTWMISNAVYLGLTIKLGDLGGNKYFNMAMAGFVEIPACILTLYFMDRHGRKGTYSWSLLVTSIICLCLVVMPIGSFTATILALLGKLSISMSTCVCWMHATEIYPTSIRNKAMSLCSMAGRFGCVIAPLILTLGRNDSSFDFLIFGLSLLIACIASFQLPETLNKSLPETLDDFHDADILINTMLP